MSRLHMLTKTLILVPLTLMVVACSVSPKQMTDNDIKERVSHDQMKLYVEQELIFKPISFNEAVARALKYNLDYRLKMMESALSAGILDMATYDTLPRLMASAGYSSRSNYSATNSMNIENGIISPAFSTSDDKSHTTGSLQFTWNALDFGMSYYRAHQRADEFLVSEERRKRVAQNILMDVRSAYWRAVGAQRLLRKANDLNTRVHRALLLSREAETQGLMPPREALTYQRLLLDSVALIAARRQELSFAKRELAALLNITPGTDFSVVEQQETSLMPVPYNVSELEEFAISNRPELKEEDYRRRITAFEAKRNFASLLPGISFNTGINYDSNSFNYNESWVDTGVQLSYNLLSPLSIPAIRGAGKARAMNDEARRLSLTMAVITQVRLSIEQYRLSLNKLEIARQSNLVDQRLGAYAQAAANNQSDTELELIRVQTRALNSEFERYAAYAEAQAAFGRVYNSLGLEVVPEGFESLSISELASQVESHTRAVQEDVFAVKTMTALQSRPIELRVQLPQAQQSLSNLHAVQARVIEALMRNGISVSKANQPLQLDQERPLLVVSLETDNASNSKWSLEMIDTMGKQIGYQQYLQQITGTYSIAQMLGESEAAVLANIPSIQQWLEAQSWSLNASHITQAGSNL
ncbi:TolC family protein [Marinomonas fungiae]|uniref:Outer membrane protein TolC n=1 Tax=Marinomonas fungiae TaxID=1137284 RepID=A0A0K6IGZ2_9GAMM|nr:TolC family protein [Marinomonas fungiae]CUB02326.1 Outer membrane protein TolC [Marinomonas fungiae]